MTNIRTGLSFAATAALVALSATAAPAAAQSGRGAAATVHCYGVNTCRGTSACRTAANDCRGQNTCRGQGFSELTARQCSARHGSLTPPAPAAPAANPS